MKLITMLVLAVVMIVGSRCGAASSMAGAPPPDAEPSIAEQRPGTWVLRLAARPLEDVGKLPYLSYESAFAYDRRAKVVVMWGGHGLRCDSPQQDETWLYNPFANRWRKVPAARRPVGSCCVRDMCYDEIAGRVVQFEGHHGNHGWQLKRGMKLRTSVPWLFDAHAGTWTPMRPMLNPTTRPYKCLAYSPDHAISVVFAGEGRPNDTWAYDSYTNTWYEMTPPAAPPRRLGGGMCYDRKHKLFVMFGSSGYQMLDDTWTYDPVTDRWTRLEPEHSPPKGVHPVLVYDEAAQTTLCFYSKGRDLRRMHIWALDLDKLDWQEVSPPEGGPEHFDFCITYVPELNIHVVGPGHTNWETGHPTVRQVWTYRYKEGKAALPPPAVNWTVTTEDDAVVVNVKEADKLKDAHLFRAEGEHPWKLKWKEVTPAGGLLTSFRDTNVERGKVYHYKLKVRDRFTYALRAQGPVPPCPMVVPRSPKGVEVSWPASLEKDVVGYHLYRAEVQVRPVSQTAADRITGFGPVVKVNRELLTEPRYIDAADLSAPEDSRYQYALYAYLVRGVNRLGVESGPSPYALTIPEQMALPELVQEAPGKVTIRWKKHPSPAVAGYHVWRKTETYTAAKQVTHELVKGTKFTDTTLAGTAMRRYYVLAVDFLGQEGISSAGVWAFRGDTAAPLD